MTPWAKRIKDLYRQKADREGITYGDLAAAAGVKTPSVMGWFGEGGQAAAQTIKGDNLVRVAAYLGTTAEFIMTGRQSGAAGTTSQSVGIDPERLASSIRLGKLAHRMLELEFDPEIDSDTVALAYAWLEAQDQSVATPDNVVDFSKYMKQRAQGAGDAGSGRAGEAGRAVGG